VLIIFGEITNIVFIIILSLFVCLLPMVIAYWYDTINREGNLSDEDNFLLDLSYYFKISVFVITVPYCVIRYIMAEIKGHYKK